MALIEAELSPGPTGRHLSFAQRAREKTNVYRRVVGHGFAWELVAMDACSPFVDTEPFPAGTTLEYHVQCLNQKDDYQGHSSIARLTVA